MILLVALAGGLGASLRFVTDGLLRPMLGDRLPWGTLLINVVGSAALGGLFGAGAGEGALAIVGTGLLGGFTTFSTASYESAALALEKRWASAVGYAAGTLFLTVAAAALGYCAASYWADSMAF